MDGPSTSAAALKEEIARLTGAINRHKTTEYRPRPPTGYNPASKPRNNVYVNPNYKPPSKPASTASTPRLPPSKPSGTNDKRDVVIGGVAFESSGRSLVRKDLAQAKPKPPPSKPPMKNASFARTKADAFVNASKMYKPKGARRGRPTNRNMTLNNTRRPYQPGARRRKYVERPCPRFTTTGACNRGLTCPYQHDPAKIAICWPFLQGNCPHTASTCPLSHDPTPERTPLCVHFANAGRCTRANCPFPHVRVGAREGVCRDFAVLGYCEKGLDCEHQHVRECPDFAEKGACTTKGCKLPHVIRANRNRLPPPPPAQVTTSSPGSHGTSEPAVSAADLDSGIFASSRVLTAEDGQLGDEFISLTFHESDSDEDDDADDDDADSEGGEQVDEEGEDETSSLAVIHD
ncbi:hypothetical protein PHLGIDRAFT_103840 [Phlebiopsis gigantea 11061_1 CR5-6]|uniref:C3H1-type domain-containing protein n=1 Tax=Phlebiopsis gigantea (strain 11061_1 CR5-6) TaxID=745531 RepID=A0A0C3S1A5_PHLG1|nr:hypothetical protein PHLGIDRAFT_103840 [Phlebiopsis gigantea 11061_1 CR5-6]